MRVTRSPVCQPVRVALGTCCWESRQEPRGLTVTLASLFSAAPEEKEGVEDEVPEALSLRRLPNLQSKRPVLRSQ